MKKIALLCLIVLAASLIPSAGFSGSTIPEGYTEISIEGFQILVRDSLIRRDAALWENTRRELASQLFRIVRDVPEIAVQRLRQSPVWIEDTDAPSAMWAHIDVGWLKANGYLPEKVNCIEIRNPRLFVSWCKDQPSMVLHEMAHVYHNKFLHRNPEIQKAYQDALQSGTYEKVLHINGRTVRAYAMNNDMEYFAETAEAFFGTNDMYPFVRAELNIHDPNMFELHKRLWTLPDEKSTTN
ncbi:hypothetical protein ACQ9LF_11380 [Anaerohalosphaeraceae bacterium U12dextr]